MNPANILLAIELITGLTKKIMSYADAIKQARAEGRDLTDSELDAMAQSADQAIELARIRIEALR